MAVDKANASSIYEVAFDLKTLTDARIFLKKFEMAQGYYLQCYDNQAKSSPKHQANVRMARMYLSHFIQVLNLSVIRSEVRVAQKKLYGLPSDNSSVPDLTSEVSIVEWGRQVINGEQQRIAQGGIPIYSPTIARVKVYYDMFMDTYDKQKNLQKLTNWRLEQLAAMRANADALILNIWNQVETRFADVLPNDRRLEKCREYGLIYYYRSSEKTKQNTDETD